jgi:hypothetical protein
MIVRRAADIYTRVDARVLANRVSVIVRDSRWGGGVHRDHLLALVGCDQMTLNAAIAIACKRRLVDVAWGWVVVPARSARQGVAA